MYESGDTVSGAELVEQASRVGSMRRQVLRIRQRQEHWVDGAWTRYTALESSIGGLRAKDAANKGVGAASRDGMRGGQEVRAGTVIFSVAVGGAGQV